MVKTNNDIFTLTGSNYTSMKFNMELKLVIHSYMYDCILIYLIGN